MPIKYGVRPVPVGCGWLHNTAETRPVFWAGGTFSHVKHKKPSEKFNKKQKSCNE